MVVRWWVLDCYMVLGCLVRLCVLGVCLCVCVIWKAGGGQLTQVHGC